MTAIDLLQCILTEKCFQIQWSLSACPMIRNPKLESALKKCHAGSYQVTSHITAMELLQFIKTYTHQGVTMASNQCRLKKTKNAIQPAG